MATTLASALSAYGGSWLMRWWRGFRWDDNPVRRASDRRETAAMAGVACLFLVAVPAAALFIGHAVHDFAVERSQQQLANRTLVTATVDGGMTRGGGPYATRSTAHARWTSPSGKLVTGVVFVSPATQSGTTVRTWVTKAGQPAGVPMSRTDVGVETVSSVLATSGVLAGFLVLLGWGLRRHVSRDRQQLWDKAWAYTEPLWSGRRR